MIYAIPAGLLLLTHWQDFFRTARRASATRMGRMDSCILHNASIPSAPHFPFLSFPDVLVGFGCRNPTGVATGLTRGLIDYHSNFLVYV